MKHLIPLFLFPLLAYSQSYKTNVFVEVVDTSEVVYHRYVGEDTWHKIQRGDKINEAELEKDSIGIDSFKLIRLYWYDPDQVKRYYPKNEKIYIKPRLLDQIIRN